jgi:hypothetical protein
MYTMRYYFSLCEFVRDVFSYYQLRLGQLHPNGWTCMPPFEDFCRMVGLEPIVNVFRSCYHLVFSTDDDNDMCWFFTFTNRSNIIMKNMLTRKPNPAKKWRGRWLFIRYIKTIDHWLVLKNAFSLRLYIIILH